VNIDEAIDLIEQAYELDPEDPAIIDSLGWAHYLRGELDTAAALLNQAWNIMEDAEIGAHYGEVLWQLGQQEQARRIWRTSLELNAQLPTLRQTLEKFEPTLLDQE
ncbi:tetratricopeptide repeat protein, partial [Latilactobacillus sakei subsp. carnosus]